MLVRQIKAIMANADHNIKGIGVQFELLILILNLEFLERFKGFENEM